MRGDRAGDVLARRGLMTDAGRATVSRGRESGSLDFVSGRGCTEPVTSGEACGREANGVSIKRSLLQPASPAAKPASRARRDAAREREGSTKEDMDHSLVRNNG